jgi:hypothetical protein
VWLLLVTAIIVPSSLILFNLMMDGSYKSRPAAFPRRLHSSVTAVETSNLTFLMVSAVDSSNLKFLIDTAVKTSNQTFFIVTAVKTSNQTFFIGTAVKASNQTCSSAFAESNHTKWHRTELGASLTEVCSGVCRCQAQVIYTVL